MNSPFNPLAIENLSKSIVTQILETEPTRLDQVPRFFGAGLYAIYYCGDYSAYQLLSRHNRGGGWNVPIYVGKAVPAGGRRGIEVVNHGTTQALTKRIGEHAGSVQAAINLDITQFSVRWLTVEDIWIPLGESAMLRKSQPLWNALVDGFGNHDPGRGRRAGVRSRWDTLHPGRPWAGNFPERPESASDIDQDVQEYLRQRLSS